MVDPRREYPSGRFTRLEHDERDHSEAPGVEGGAALGEWTDYTPTWTTTGSAPALGDGTVDGRYKMLDATTCVVQVSFVFGSTSNVGSGEFRFALPPGLSSVRVQAVVGHILDAGVRRHAAIAIVPEGTTIGPITAADASGDNVVKAAVPMTWAAGDAIDISGILEVEAV